MENIKKILSTSIDTDLVEQLLEHYQELKQKFLLGQYELSQLKCAKFAEVVMRALEWVTKKSYTPFDKSLSLDELAKELEKLRKDKVPGSVRIHIPRILRAIYDIRSKRGVAHVGKVNPNLMDATFVVSACDWIMAELVSLYHTNNPAQAQKIVDCIVERKLPIIEEFGEELRVLKTGLPVVDQILIILYRKHPSYVSTSDLKNWIKTRYPTYITTALRRLDYQAKIHRKGSENIISRRGIKYVEENLPKEI